MNGVIFNFKMIKALTSPITPPASSVIKMATGKGNPACAIKDANITDAKAAVAPTDKSIMPEIRHNPMPTAIIP